MAEQGDRGSAPQSGAGDEPQVPVPPYDDERGPPGENTAPAAFDASRAPVPDPGSAVSAEERSGVTGTETDPEPALGVGSSRGGRAEDTAPDRDDVDTKGASDRPVGRATQDDEDDPVDPGSPDLQTGDQGG